MWVVLALLFFFSGTTSLIYEIIWIRVLALGIGSTSAAMSIVLAIFFLGLSVGSWLSYKYFLNYSRPLKLYAYLEGFIGLYSCALIFALIYFHRLLAFLPLEGSLSWIGTIAKFLIVGALLLAPTIAMGASLPLIVRVFGKSETGSNRSVSFLYALNTLGGVLGVLLASYLLIPRLGILYTNQLCALLNLGLLGFGILLSKNPTFVPVKKSEPAVLEAAEPQWKYVFLSGLCGFASLLSEVVWNKYLGIFLGHNIYGLGIVLSVYLLGIALGSLLFFALNPAIQRMETLFWTLIVALPLVLTSTSFCFSFLPVLASLIGYSLVPYLSLLAIKSLLSILLLLPSTLILGLLFPMTVQLVSEKGFDSSKSVGTVYAVNTLGAIFGSCIAGLVLIPLWGSSFTIKIGAGLLILGAVYFLLQDKRLFKLPSTVGIGLALAGLYFFGNLDFTNIIKSAYVSKIAGDQTLAQNLRFFSKDSEEFRWIKEGETSVISLSHDPADGPQYKEILRLKTNGLNESVYVLKHLGRLPRYEALLGLLPYLFTDSPKTAFVVGYGGGYTVDLLTSFPIPKVTVIELERAILEAADIVYVNRNPILQRENLDLKIEDARFVLASKTKAPLDIIVSQPSHSWLAGAANLFTEEFFNIVKVNLSDRGIFSQWLNLYNMDAKTLKSILATFFHVFPYGGVFSGQGDQEMILIGSKRPLVFNSKEALRLTSSSRYQNRLASVPFYQPADVLSHFALSRTRVLQIAEDTPLNTDLNAFAETRQSRFFYSGISPEESPQLFLKQNYAAGFSDLLDGAQEWAFNILVSLQQTGQYEKFYTYLSKFENNTQPNDPKKLAQLGYLCLRAQRYSSAKSYLEKAFENEPSSENLNLLISSLIELQQNRKALDLIQTHSNLNNMVTHCYRAKALATLGKWSESRPLFLVMEKEIPNYTQACGDFFNRLMGDYYFHERKYSIALPFYEAFIQNYPNDVGTLKNISSAHIHLNQWAKAAQYAGPIQTASNFIAEQLNALSRFYVAQNLLGDADVLRERIAQTE